MTLTKAFFALGMVVAAARLAAGAAPADGVLFHESFDDANLTNRNWYDGTESRIARGSWAGQGCLEYEWIGPDAKVSGSSTIRRLFGPTDQVWIRFHLKLSKGWSWTGRNYHPHLINILTTENSKWHGPAASHLTLYVEPQNGKLRLAAQDIQNQSMPHGLTQGPLKGGYNGTLYDSPTVLFTDDKWHCIEACFKLNTLDLKNDRPNRDGIVRGWFDGKLVIEHTNVVLRSTDFPKMKFNQFLLAPYFGPGLLPHAQRLWMDELTVGTKRPELPRRGGRVLENSPRVSIQNFAGAGIRVYAHNNVIEDNVIVANGGGILLSFVEHNQILNNVVTGHQAHGISIFGGPAGSDPDAPVGADNLVQANKIVRATLSAPTKMELNLATDYTVSWPTIRWRAGSTSSGASNRIQGPVAIRPIPSPSMAETECALLPGPETPSGAIRYTATQAWALILQGTE